jgi:hypothetical protein
MFPNNLGRTHERKLYHFSRTPEREYQAARRRIDRVDSAINELLARNQRPDGQTG